MYSESSSDTESLESSYCFPLKHKSSYYYNWQNPFYPTFGHPLVYYAQIPSSKKYKDRESKKRNPNCFVKAFRWYTQEHEENPKTKFTHNNPDVMGFATWLDSKYEQFVQEKQMQAMEYTLKLKSTSIIETKKSQNPWRKRKSNKDGRKSNRSLEYIFQPIDVTRPASEYILMSQSYCNYSNPTLRSTEYQDSKKLRAKSQSLSNIRNKSKNQNDLLVSIQEGFVRKMNVKATYDVIPPQNDFKLTASSKAKSIDHIKDMSCQCFDTTEKIDREVQEDTLKDTVNEVPTKPSTSYALTRLCCAQKCCEIDKKTKTVPAKLIGVPKNGTVKKIVKELDPKHKVTCLCSDTTSKIYLQARKEHSIRTSTNNKGLEKKQSMLTCAACDQTDSEVLKAFETLTNKASSVIVFVNDAVQTSDYPIILEDNVRNYPLFMRVIYADKLD